MSKCLKVSATGDSLFVADIPSEYNADLKTVSSFIGDCDVRITNLETNISKFGEFANAYSGGTWLNTEPHVFDDLTKYGFNYYGTANNHCMDYSYHGLLSTIDELDKRGLAHSGTGRSLEQASAPAVIDASGTKVAIIAVTTEFNLASKAGPKTIYLDGRPGVNYVGCERYYQIDKDKLAVLKEIADKTNINATRNLSIKGGFVLPDPDGIFNFGEVKFCYDGTRKNTECNKKDKERLVNTVKKAKEENDYVLVLIHCHHVKKDIHCEVPEFLEELSHACIDAGASAMIGGGTHELRGIEIYNGCPIFYSLGDFIYQGMRVPILPADFMEKYGIDINSTGYEGLMARSKGGKIGLQAHKCNFMSVVPKMEFEDGKLKSLVMMPTVAGFDREGKMAGLPYHAKGEESKQIFDVLVKLSKEYGTELAMSDDIIELKIK